MSRTREIAAALQAVIFTGNWDYAGELSDAANFVDCLRCFAAPQLLEFDDESRCFYTSLFCASCWYAHLQHWLRAQSHRRRAMSVCPECNIVGFIQARSVDAGHA